PAREEVRRARQLALGAPAPDRERQEPPRAADRASRRRVHVAGVELPVLDALRVSALAARVAAARRGARGRRRALRYRLLRQAFSALGAESRGTNGLRFLATL